MKILLANDGSEFGKAAVDKCCDTSGHLADVEILILSAADPIILPMEPFAFSAEYLEEADQAATAKAESIVQAAAEQVRSAIPAIGERLAVKVAKGKPAQAIVEEAEKWGADVIVVGSHGYGFWQRTFLGSVSNAVVHHSPCSVLVVRPKRNARKPYGT